MPDRRSLSELPKAHLHVHLEGAMRPDTLDELCARYRIDRPVDTRGRRFTDFGGFNALYWAATHCLRTREDLARLVMEVAEDAAREGVRWIEPAFDAERYSTLRAEGPFRLFEDQTEGWRFVFEAAEAAERATGVGIGFMSAIDRTRALDSAMARARVTAALVRSGEHLIESGMPDFEGRHPALVAVGLHGNEQGHPPEPFDPAFRVALEGTGLLCTPHAGEIAPAPGGGPRSVAGALDALGADRILHGVLAVEEPALVARLARAGVCLDVCPSSNVLLSVVPSLREHPLPQLLEAGVACSLGSDDPLLFGPSLLQEYTLCGSEMELGDVDLARLARSSFEHSAAPAEVKARALADIESWLGANG